MALVLRKPTVGDVVEFLAKCRQDAAFTMEDADTNWIIDVIHVSVSENGDVEFSGQYGEMG